MMRSAKWPLLAVWAMSCADVESDEQVEGSSTELAQLLTVDPGICQEEFVPTTGGVQPDNTLTDQQFYAWSNTTSLAGEPNGKLVRCQKLKKTDSYQKYRVLYKTSTKVTDRGVTTELPLIASGQVWVPELPAGVSYKGNRPVLSNTHGAVGVISSKCAPSLNRSTDSLAALRDLSTGSWANAVLTVPDYVGLGVDHGYRTPDSTALDKFGHTYLDRVTHPFVSIESEARSVIDLVRTAQSISGAGVGENSKWLVVGVSQGGHAALATAELWSREDYAKGGPTLKGAIAGAPASELQDRRWWPTEAVNAVFAMMTAGSSMENRDVRASALFNDFAKVAFGATTNVGCFDTIQQLFSWWGAYAFSPSTSIFNQNLDSVFNTPSFKAVLLKNSPGNLTETLKVPVFIGTLRGDPMIREERVRAAVALYRKNPANNVTFCYYSAVASGFTNAELAPNHNAYRRMFPQKNADGSWVDKPQLPSCTGPGGSNAVITPVEWAAKL